jgi:L-threonylcarbamoyladenylate synthase
MMQTETGQDLDKAAHWLKADQVVAIPTETVYGLAGNALSEKAVAAIYAAKQRPQFNPLILHVARIDDMRLYAQMDNVSRLLAEAFMPGPLTLLLPKRDLVPDITTAGSRKVALRMPRHPMAMALLEMLDFPLAAPSANPSGYISPTTAQHVWEGLHGIIPYILDGGPSQVGVESTICEYQDDKIILHRTGAITADMLEAVAHVEVIPLQQQNKLHAPGQMKSHYAPNTPLYRGDIPELLDRFSGKNTGVISFQTVHENPHTTAYCLSPAGDLAAAANALFAQLRIADQAGHEVLVTEWFPESGVGTAINDRLGRALAEHKQKA